MKKLPSHVAIIMDGNGRWAKKRLLNRVKGHEKGAETVREIVRTSRELGIKFLTLYAFSTENWERPKAEVSALMNFLKKFLISERKEMIDNNIRLNAIGQTDRLPQAVKEELEKSKSATQDNDGMLLNLALSYGGREELERSIKKIASEVQNGNIQPEDITADLISGNLYTAGMPDPDLMIRTSGEERISNFLLWQVAYAELVFTETLWPDFNSTEYIEILKSYQTRERRFGKILL